MVRNEISAMGFSSILLRGFSMHDILKTANKESEKSPMQWVFSEKERTAEWMSFPSYPKLREEPNAVGLL